jgi:hypothetical protein
MDAPTAGDDALYQAQRGWAGDVVGQGGVQDGVVYRGEELHDVTLQHVGVTAGELGAAIQGGMCALAHTAGIAVVDEAGFPDGFDDVAEGVMDNAVTLGRWCLPRRALWNAVSRVAKE